MFWVTNLFVSVNESLAEWGMLVSLPHWCWRRKDWRCLLLAEPALQCMSRAWQGPCPWRPICGSGADGPSALMLSTGQSCTGENLLGLRVWRVPLANVAMSAT